MLFWKHYGGHRAPTTFQTPLTQERDLPPCVAHDMMRHDASYSMTCQCQCQYHGPWSMVFRVEGGEKVHFAPVRLHQALRRCYVRAVPTAPQGVSLRAPRHDGLAAGGLRHCVRERDEVEEPDAACIVVQQRVDHPHRRVEGCQVALGFRASQHCGEELARLPGLFGVVSPQPTPSQEPVIRLLSLRSPRESKILGSGSRMILGLSGLRVLESLACPMGTQVKLATRRGRGKGHQGPSVNIMDSMEARRPSSNLNLNLGFAFERVVS